MCGVDRFFFCKKQIVLLAVFWKWVDIDWFFRRGDFSTGETVELFWGLFVFFLPQHIIFSEILIWTFRVKLYIFNEFLVTDIKCFSLVRNFVCLWVCLKYAWDNFFVLWTLNICKKKVHCNRINEREREW